jgi:hypothetical protein
MTNGPSLAARLGVAALLIGLLSSLSCAPDDTKEDGPGSSGSSGHSGNAGGEGAAGSSTNSGFGGGGNAGTGSTNGGGGNAGTGGTNGGGGNAGTGGTHGGGGGAGNTGGGMGNDSVASDAARQACVDRINGFRATLGLTPLARWTEQESCSDAEAKSDSMTGDAHSAFGRCGEGAQNECPGWGSVDQVVQDCLQDMWDEGPGEPYSDHGHYINMSNPDYERVACGFAKSADGGLWAVQNFR